MMRAMDLYSTYRKMFATLADERVVWWYCGGVTAPREGVGLVPHVQAETIMVYRSRDAGPDSFTIDWTEVGYFRDIATGEPLEGWFNPFTQRTEPYPKTFVDGPATFTVRRVDHGGVDIHLVQSGAHIEGVSLTHAVHGASVGLVQTESKRRTFHRPDGSLPPLDSPEATQIETVLSIWSPLSAVDDAAVRNAPAAGFYSSGSKSGSSGGWASTVVSGVMRKARPHERINPQAWERLREKFPAFFSADGERIDPAFD
jgi:hypothetical protein